MEANQEPDLQLEFANKIKEQTQALISDFKNNVIDKKSYTDKVLEIESKLKSFATADEFNKYSKEVEGILLKLKELEESPKAKAVSSHKSISSLISENISGIKEVLKRKSGEFELTYKATQLPTDIGSGDIFNLLGRDAWFTWLDGGRVFELPYRKPVLAELFRRVQVNNEFVKIAYQDTAVRDAKFVAGCNPSTHNTKLTWKEKTFQLTKVRDFITICLDMIEDYPFVEQQIRDLLLSSVAQQIDTGLLLGNGTAPNITGIDAYSSVFSATNPAANFGTSVKTPNIADLISVAAKQIEIFGQGNYRADTVLLNPIDAAKIMFAKSTDGTPLYGCNPCSPVQSNGGYTYINGLRVVTSTLVTPNTMYVFDSSRGYIIYKPGANIGISYENRDNFEIEMVTIKSYARMNFVVSPTDINAFMKITSISAALTAITAP